MRRRSVPLAAMLARKFGVCLMIAHQRIGQLNPPLTDALEEDAGSFVALRTGAARESRQHPIGRSESGET